MSEIRIGFDAVEAAGTSLSGEAKTTEQLLEEVNAQVAALKDAWDGESAEQWGVLQDQFGVAYEDMKSALHGLGNTTSEAANVYRSTEKAVGDMFA